MEDSKMMTEATLKSRLFQGTLLEDDAEKTDIKCSVFISYARADKSFAVNLKDDLKSHGHDVFCDLEMDAIAASSALGWNAQIEAHDIFLFVISPQSLETALCVNQLEYALQNGKRMLLVVCRPYEEEKLHKNLRLMPKIFFADEAHFGEGMKLVFDALTDDQRHSVKHTKLLRAAIVWEKSDFEKTLLLRGSDLKRAKLWLAAAALGKDPKPTPLHLSFITASDSLNTSMKKRRLIAFFFAVIVTIGIIWPSWGVFFFSLVFAHFFVYLSSN